MFVTISAQTAQSIFVPSLPSSSVMSEEISTRAAEVRLPFSTFPFPRIDCAHHWIHVRTSQHDALLRSIEAVDYAPPTLKQVQVQLKQNQAQLADDIKKLKALEAATQVPSLSFPSTTDPTEPTGRKNTQNGPPSGTVPTREYGPRSPTHAATRRS